MTTSTFSHHKVGEIAVTLPGAAAVFRMFGISFGCATDLSLAEAAEKRGLDTAEIDAALAALVNVAHLDIPKDTGPLIDHILTRFHETHRREFPELLLLADKVERMHGERQDVPKGLVALLNEMAAELDTHMQKEEIILFPMMRGGGNPMIVHPIARMRDEHDGHAVRLRELEHVTDSFRLPEDVCRSWQALYAGTKKLADDLVAHMHVENTVLFPRFEYM